jgi:hypothetical protein
MGQTMNQTMNQTSPEHQLFRSREALSVGCAENRRKCGPRSVARAALWQDRPREWRPVAQVDPSGGQMVAGGWWGPRGPPCATQPAESFAAPEKAAMFDVGPF